MVQADHMEAATPSLLLPSNLPESVVRADWLKPWAKSEQVQLRGYQLWAVEQRICDRNAVLPVIVVLTNNDVDELSLDRYTMHSLVEQNWEYTRAILKSAQAKLIETEHGWIPLTRLPSLDPELNIVHLPGADYAAVRSQLYANINLRRLGLGGRSGLKLASPTAAQQLNFRQLFRLPKASDRHAVPLDDFFNEQVLALVALVQNALSLYGLGPVLAAPSVTRSSLTKMHSLVIPVDAPLAGPWTGSDSDTEDEADSVASGLEPALATSTLNPLTPSSADGLLCDTTVAALAFFHEHVAPLSLRIDDHDRGHASMSIASTSSSVMSPSLLAALLSTSICARGRLASLAAAPSVPRDVFARPRRFLEALEVVIRSQQWPGAQHFKGAVLTRFGLDRLAHAWAREKAHDESRRTSKVSRVLKSKLAGVGQHHRDRDGALSDTGGGGGGAAGGGDDAGHRHGESDETEAMTDSLDVLVASLHRGIGGATAGALWGVKRKEGRSGRRLRHGDGVTVHDVKDRDREEEKRKEGLDEAGVTSAPSDGDSTVQSGAGGAAGTTLSIGRSVIRGVKNGAGRAGRILNDSLGFSDPHPATTQVPLTSSTHVTTGSRLSSRQATHETIRQPTGTSSQSHSRANSLANRVSLALSSSPPPASLNSERIAEGHTSLSPAASIRQRMSVSPAAGGRSVLASLTAGDDKHPPPPPPPSTHPTVEGGISPAIQRRLAGPRRVASDHGVSTLPPTEVDKADDEGLAADVEVGHGSSAASRPILARGGKRRHSFNLVRDAPEPWQILSRKRLVLDFNLRVTFWTLHLREKKLEDMLQALKTVQVSYDDAISSLEPVLATKTAKLESLSAAALSLAQRADSYSSTTSPTAKLSIGSSRLHYAQSVVEEKLSDVTDFERMITLKVGPGGTLDLGSKALGKERSGMRSLVTSIERWRDWLGFLTVRGAHHLRLRRDDSVAEDNNIERESEIL